MTTTTEAMSVPLLLTPLLIPKHLFFIVRCKGIERLLIPAIKGDREQSVVVCPISQDNVGPFLNSVTGADGSPAADIVLLDQHIDINGEVREN